MNNLLTDNEYAIGLDGIIRAFGNGQKIAWTEDIWKVKMKGALTRTEQRITWLYMFAMRKWTVGDPMNYVTDKQVIAMFSHVKQFMTVECKSSPGSYLYPLTLSGSGIMISCPDNCGGTSSTGTSAVIPLDYISPGGESVITLPATKNKTVLSAARDGVGQRVLLSGTPAQQEIRHNPANGEFTLPDQTIYNEWIHVTYK